MNWIDIVKGKDVVFITTKNRDYIRNTQEIRLLEGAARSVTVIGSPEKSYIRRLLHVGRRLLLLRRKRFDAVFVGFAPQLVLPLWAFKFRGKPVIEDFFISLYDTFVDDRKRFTADSLMGRLLLALDRRTLALSDRVIADTRAHADYFATELGCDRDRLEVLYLEADPQIYAPDCARQTPPGPDGRGCRVLYFGSVLPVQGVDVVMEAVGKLADCDALSFELIGPVRDEWKVQGERIQYHPWLEQAELARHIANADLCLAGHFSGTVMKARRTIPGKAYIYRAMNKPMILGDTPANRELFTEGEDIWFCPVGDANALAETIKRASAEILAK